ncbi:MAG: protein kinase [Candidatus Krumholzibacteriota bacterium]|nr:protein kinase [Candidatus Krumholzibacteriota bacterium]
MENRNYQILNTLATGGTSVLYKAIQKSLDRNVVIKKLHSHLTSDKNFTGRFELEARAAASLNHENIVRIIDTGKTNNNYYIVMEYIEGLTLKDILDRNGALGDELTLLIAREICLGLDHAHKRGIIHRDIKPANIMITNKGQVKITDFGLAKLSQSHLEQTVADTLLGTPLYMSPEQAVGECVDGRSDIFSLGSICYEMATGRQPFSGTNYAAVIQNIINGSIPLPSKVCRSVGSAAESVVMKALSREPEKRFATALDMAREIESLLGQEKVVQTKSILKDLVAGDKRTPEIVKEKHTAGRSLKKTLSYISLAAVISISGLHLYYHPGQISRAGEFVNGLLNRFKENRVEKTVLSAEHTGAGIADYLTAEIDTSRIETPAERSRTDTVYIEVPVPSAPVAEAPEDSASILVEEKAKQPPSETSTGQPETPRPEETSEREEPKITTGFIDISVEPEAEITIDGVFRLSGNRYGPVEIEAGAHSVSCRQKDFVEYFETIVITKGELSRRRICLDMLKGDLVFSISPGIRIFINGQFRGITPLSGKIPLPTGKHLIDLKKSGYKDWSNEIFIPAEETVTIKIDLIAL